MQHRYREFDFMGIGRKARGLIAPSLYVARQVERYFKSDCSVIHYGTDINYFTPPESKDEAKIKSGDKPDEAIILSVAALEKRKGIQKIIDALPEIIKRIRKVKFIVLGGGEYQKHLEAMIKNKKLEEYVYLKGEVSYVRDYYRAADLFILLAEFEANSIACFEAMACSLPMITSEGSSFGEFIKKDFGFMVDGDDTESTAKTILKVLEDKDFRLEAGKYAREYAVKNFSWEKATEELCNLFF